MFPADFTKEEARVETHTNNEGEIQYFVHESSHEEAGTSAKKYPVTCFVPRFPDELSSRLQTSWVARSQFFTGLW
ncbi:hypothetical protein KFL_000680090 [Klebsormidium nitens]|uniref:Uncharacterized protein n=1 Tax=Klebsormidium nitens TaxID=105231 RepID=A0A0U9HRC2_KLENI|nr:hypothetical protein KFL_000680090 [Klebsormidium nitens]|eukprot:GAQ80993.1 hypothetical protein KFL_000680090 [Klebsormidium nitens]